MMACRHCYSLLPLLGANGLHSLLRNVDLSDPDGWMECSENGDTATVADARALTLFALSHIVGMLSLRSSLSSEW